jgi:hypothetical protein
MSRFVPPLPRAGEGRGEAAPAASPQLFGIEVALTPTLSREGREREKASAIALPSREEGFLP